MIPSKEDRIEWHKLAENSEFQSAFGEYTPEEFIVLLDAIDEIEEENKQLKRHQCLNDFCIERYRG